MNYKKNSEPAGEQMTLFSQAGSLNYASHTQPLESDLAKKMNATCGPKCLESFGRFSRNGLWAKMFSALLIGQEGWYSRRCKLTWKVKGTKYNRMYFQLRASTLPTKGTGFGLLPTATAQDFKRRGPNSKQQGLSNTENWSNLLPNLATQVMGLLKTPCAADAYTENLSKKEQKFGNSGTLAQEIQSGFVEQRWPGLLPTPTMYDYNSARHPELWEKDKKKYADKGINLQCGLKQMNVLGMLPTPQARDWKGCEGRRHDVPSYIQDSMRLGTGTTSQQLNPQFVLEMMGFPPNWTELPFLNGETNQSRPGETQSCPK
jgi:hypothetical protein